MSPFVSSIEPSKCTAVQAFLKTFSLLVPGPGT